jgi:hypothetical protein
MLGLQPWASEPHHFNTDPVPDPALNADPDPDPVSRQSHGNLRPLVHRPPEASIVSVHTPLHGSILTLSLWVLNFDINADPYPFPAFHSNADPDLAYKSNADPDPQFSH